MSLTRKGASDLDVIAEKVVDKLLSSDKFVESLTMLVRKSIHDELQAISKGFEQKVAQLEKDFQSRISDLEDVIDCHEQYSRVNSIRIFGIVEQDDENTANVVRAVCEEKLGVKLSPGAIDIAHRTKKKGTANRPIIVKFASRMDKKMVLSNKKKLKGTRISVREDLTWKRVQRLRKLMDKFGGKNCWSSDGNLLVRTGDAVHKVITEKDFQNLVNNLSILNLG